MLSDVEPWFRALFDQGVAIVGLVALALVVTWLGREYIRYLKDEAAYWRTMALGATEAIEHLAASLENEKRRR